MNNASLKIGVVGMGPVGSILAAHFADAGAWVVACDVVREKTDRIRDSGIRLVNAIEKQVKVAKTCYSVTELGGHDLDLVSISVKTPYLKRVLKELLPVASPSLFVMSAQNGIDNEEEVARVFGRDRTLRMVINYAGSMEDLNTVDVTFFNPPNYLAPLSDHGELLAQRLVGLLNSVGLKTQIPGDIRVHVWTKAIMNAALCPVSALTGLTMEDVMETAFGVETVTAILDEGIEVAGKEGIHLPEGFRDQALDYMKKGGRHRPSMLVDVEKGLPTEIDHLNGKIVEYGKRHGVATPTNGTLAALIRLVEKRITHP
ncbi:MAG: ketopantoate reductase family protein [Fidelibacterota bacterium]